MGVAQRRRFIHAHLAWVLVTIVLLTALDALSLELVFVLSLIGLLVVTELTAPINVTPRWRSRLKWIIGGGLVIFGAIVIRRILEILSGVLWVMTSHGLLTVVG